MANSEQPGSLSKCPVCGRLVRVQPNGKRRGHWNFDTKAMCKNK